MSFKINIENFDKFIFKGALALESYFDYNNTNKEIFDEFNAKLKKYRQLPTKTNENKEYIVSQLVLTFEKLGIGNFIIYEDGDVEYNANKNR